MKLRSYIQTSPSTSLKLQKEILISQVTTEISCLTLSHKAGLQIFGQDSTLHDHIWNN